MVIGLNRAGVSVTALVVVMSSKAYDGEGSGFACAEDNGARHEGSANEERGAENLTKDGGSEKSPDDGLGKEEQAG